MTAAPAAPRLGDVLEIRTSRGLAFAQYCGHDKLYGALIRVLPGLHPSRPDELCGLSRARESYFVFYPVRLAVKQKLVKVVAHCPNPVGDLPVMRASGERDRDGRILGWWLRDGEKTWPVEVLNNEQRSLSIAEVWMHPVLVERLESGWTPASDSESLSAAEIQNVQRASEDRNLTPAQLAVAEIGRQTEDAKPREIVHYLYFPRDSAAARAAAVLQQRGLGVVRPERPSGGNWPVLARETLPPTGAALATSKAELEELAESCGGEYDGWEVRIADEPA